MSLRRSSAHWCGNPFPFPMQIFLYLLPKENGLPRRCAPRNDSGRQYTNAYVDDIAPKREGKGCWGGFCRLRCGLNLRHARKACKRVARENRRKGVPSGDLSLYSNPIKTFQSFRSELPQNALSSLMGASPSASSAFSGTIHPRKSIKVFNQV